MSVRAGGVDWIERWREMFSAAAAGGEAREGDPWRDRAARFDRMGRRYADASIERLREGVLPTDVVADVGAGTGRHAVPMARHCARVVAVEPSAAMRARLEARIAEEHAAVRVVAGPWPCAIEPVDVIYSCHVLYGVAEAASFLEHMTRAARRTCRLLLGVRAPADRLAPLWRVVHGRERGPRPAALEALALLHQLGYPASLRVAAGSERPMTFTSTHEDLDELCHRLHLSPDDAGRARVEGALQELFPRASREEPWDLGTSGAQAIVEWPGGA